MSNGLSNFFGAMAAWLCLAPIAFARETQSMPSILAPAFGAAHHIVNFSLLLIWTTGGICLLVGGLLALVPLRFRVRKSDQLAGTAKVYRSTGFDLAWTVSPLSVLVLFLA